MTKQEEIDQLIKIVCPHLECEDGEPSITLGGFEAIQDFYAARIKERDERIMEKVTKVTIFRGTEPVREDPDVYIRFKDLEQIMKGEER